MLLDTQTFATSLFLFDLPPDNPSAYLAQFAEFTATATSHTFIFAGELAARSNGDTVAPTTTDVSYDIDNVCLNVVGGACAGQAAVPAPPTVLLLVGGLAVLALSWLTRCATDREQGMTRAWPR